MITSTDSAPYIALLGPADAFVARVLEMQCARGLALDALLRISRIVWCDDVLTAAVECTSTPQLLLNPRFVYERARDDKAIAFLVLHELAHVSFGQTGVYTQATRVQNIAFDAVINASLLRGLNDGSGDIGEWSQFVVNFYQPNKSPEFLLRPPPNWPADPDWSASEGASEALRAVHRRLYSTTFDVTRAPISSVTHAEIIQALMEDGCVSASDVLLLGSHGATEREQRAATGGRNVQAAEVLGGVLSKLPGGGGRGAGGPALTELTLRAEIDRALVKQLRALLQRTLSGSSARKKLVETTSPVVTVDPSRDRRATVRRYVASRFGAPAPLLYQSEQTYRRLVNVGRSAVYLDVSGSMYGWMERLHAALGPLRRELTPELYAFSTVVVSLSRAEVAQGRVRTSGGTEIAPVIEHAIDMAKSHGLRRAIVLTDGYVGVPSAALLRAFRASGVAMHVGCTTNYLNDLSSWAASTTVLAAGGHTR